ncbi:MAG: response regulator transcription factor [Bacteroidales bacterium]|nr:response regulator transcription factor [Bacteroidales bacterium]
MKILFAEDDKMMQKQLVYQMIKFDHEVTTVDNGKEALKAIEEDVFDVILLDIFMPKLSGLEVLEHIRNDGNSEIPVIIISRDKHPETIQKAKDLGANDYIVKPYEPDELYIKLKRVTGHTAG